MTFNLRQAPGASYLGEGRCEFRVWAPAANQVELCITAPRQQVIRLGRAPGGYHERTVESLDPGSLYFYRLDHGKKLPDPASRFQPQGVHQASEVVDPTTYSWGDRSWGGLALEQYIFYEVHVGTFSPEGTFESVIGYLDELKELGVTALELMPVAQFSGDRNWGYDGVYPFAVQNSYGTLNSLKRLIDACHQRELAVVLDVVYNHLGPEGNYLSEFGPYFTDRYRTPWGQAINFDGPESDEVRHFFISNALYWLSEFHIDALRLDAIHGITDSSAQPFLAELAGRIHEFANSIGRRLYAIAESDLNDARVVERVERGGYGLDAQWSDDLHHAQHALLTGEQHGYYRDFGKTHQLAQAWNEGFVYSGQYSVYRKRRHGNSSRSLPAKRFVVCAQNHDQVGNRMLGERLSQLVSFEALKLAAGVILLSPFLPLLFMGEEYGETAPFLYFTAHSDAGLAEAVRLGRAADFAAFGWSSQPPDPQDPSTFFRSKLDPSLRTREPHATLGRFYKELLRLRHELVPVSNSRTKAIDQEAEKLLLARHWKGPEEAFMAFHFGEAAATCTTVLSGTGWQKRMDSADRQWCGKGSVAPASIDCEGEITLQLQPKSFVVFSRGAQHATAI